MRRLYLELTSRQSSRRRPPGARCPDGHHLWGCPLDADHANPPHPSQALTVEELEILPGFPPHSQQHAKLSGRNRMVRSPASCPETDLQTTEGSSSATCSQRRDLNVVQLDTPTWWRTLTSERPRVMIKMCFPARRRPPRERARSPVLVQA